MQSVLVDLQTLSLSACLKHDVGLPEVNESMHRCVRLVRNLKKQFIITQRYHLSKADPPPNIDFVVALSVQDSALNGGIHGQELPLGFALQSNGYRPDG